MVSIPAGVYSETKVQKIGTMSTARTQTVVDYYKCVQIDEKTMSIQILDMYGEPIPMVEKVALTDFLKRFTYAPDTFKNKKSPAEITADKAISRAEMHVARKEYNSAEFEYIKAIKVDQENVRASFGLGKVYLETGETDKAAVVFSDLARQDNVMAPENKHFFNDLGIELRGLKLYEQAIEFYEKALALSQNDENLMFNIARAAFEGGDKVKATAYIDRALILNPDLIPAKKLKVVLAAAP
jgi:tetratricopeptide (TPR) repeat protein